MLSIRFSRKSKKNQPSYKVVVVDSKKSSTAGTFVEQVGFYNPLTKEKVLNSERIQYWLSVGAKASDTVHNLLVSSKITEGTKKFKFKKSRKQETASTEGSVEAKEVKEEPKIETPAETPVVETPSETKEVKEVETPITETVAETSKVGEPIKEEKAEVETPVEPVMEKAQEAPKTPKEEVKLEETKTLEAKEPIVEEKKEL